MGLRSKASQQRKHVAKAKRSAKKTKLRSESKQKKAKSKTRSERFKDRFDLRLPADVRHLIERAADIVGTTASGFLVRQAVEAAKRIVSDVDITRLPADGQEHLAQLLENPPEPTDGLVDLFTRYPMRRAE